MKALILAAGYGTRLLPHTRHLPKPLFPIDGRPLLDRTIAQLLAAGVSGIVINVHHLHSQIAGFIRSRRYPIDVITRYEETILGTGGAIKNVADFLGDEPFVVINSDIVTDIDISAVRAFHDSHPHPATLVIQHYPQFNNVWVDGDGHITAFSEKPPPNAQNLLRRAFTGIQVLDPVVLDFIPEKGFVSSIDVFRDMIGSGLRLAAYQASNHYWRDIGTPESFFEAAYDKTAPAAFEKAFGLKNPGRIDRTAFSGDGSDRRWFRIHSAAGSLILADHGIHSSPQTGEADAFVHIGRHLREKQVPVPQIYYSDRFSGLVYLEDLGDAHLQSEIIRESDEKRIIELYEQTIEALLTMAIDGADGFDPEWTYQTPAYDRPLIMERECRYFVDAFLKNYLNLPVAWEALQDECAALADLTLDHATLGLMHRDLQSRNIMVKAGRVFFIDFQGARSGPIQYDLASLLTDPYVRLSLEMEDKLVDFCVRKLALMIPLDPDRFIKGYRYCSLTRIMQSLGAFGFLTKAKHKPFFAEFIPAALNNLDLRLHQPGIQTFPLLTAAVKTALMAFDKIDQYKDEQ